MSILKNRMFRTKLNSVLRVLGLLPIANILRFIGVYLTNRQSNNRFKNKMSDFVFPPAYISYDAYNTTEYEFYYRMGFHHAKQFAELINKYKNGRKINVLDFGCGPARMIRYLPQHFKSEDKFFGCDYNKQSISWAKENIPNIDFRLNYLLPPLDYNDNSFDFVYLVSVFTHLSENAIYEWKKELFRILKKDGILIFTTIGENGYDKFLLKHEKEKFNNNELVVKGKIKEGRKQFLSYASPGYIRDKVFKDCKILEHIIHPYKNVDKYLNDRFEQDIWVIQK